MNSQKRLTLYTLCLVLALGSAVPIESKDLVNPGQRLYCEIIIVEVAPTVMLPSTKPRSGLIG